MRSTRSPQSWSTGTLVNGWESTLEFLGSQYMVCCLKWQKFPLPQSNYTSSFCPLPPFKKDDGCLIVFLQLAAFVGLFILREVKLIFPYAHYHLPTGKITKAQGSKSLRYIKSRGSVTVLLEEHVQQPPSSTGEYSTYRRWFWLASVERSMPWNIQIQFMQMVTVGPRSGLPINQVFGLALLHLGDIFLGSTAKKKKTCHTWKFQTIISYLNSLLLSPPKFFLGTPFTKDALMDLIHQRNPYLSTHSAMMQRMKNVHCCPFSFTIIHHWVNNDMSFNANMTGTASLQNAEKEGEISGGVDLCTRE